MFKLCIIGICCVGIAYAGLREDIESNFTECMNTENIWHQQYNETGQYEQINPKNSCFEWFVSKYGKTLKRQCNNDKKDECMKLIYSYAQYNADDLVEVAEKFLSICEGLECYKAGEIIGVESDIAHPLLEKACRQNIEDGCYAIGE